MLAYVWPILFVVALLLWGIYLTWQWKQTRDFASEVLRAKQESGELPASVSKEAFTDLYVRSEGPRASTYYYACAVLVTLALLPFMALVNFVWFQIWTAMGSDPVFQTGQMFHTFIMFILIMGFMIGVLAAALRRYYTLSPPTLRQIIRDLGGTPA